ncbi:spore coat protein [Paenibacillus caseinilyticus]|uniref:Spore coat protein CotH n=1 Tax=Paenibacillus mucilaginosus K02 TaxID=997761 RepID=I0BNR6_9BACL|nr:spore coat protein [Paenibacillus mucilaginosus]AFH64013.1 spore coat protein CotH [Paenibacillus mucilaginosus K02]
MHLMNDRFYALELLLTAKTAIRDTSIAISETSTPFVREALLQAFEQNVMAHAMAFHYTLSRGITPSYTPERVIQNDFENARYALQLPISQ